MKTKRGKKGEKGGKGGEDGLGQEKEIKDGGKGTISRNLRVSPHGPVVQTST